MNLGKCLSFLLPDKISSPMMMRPMEGGVCWNAAFMAKRVSVVVLVFLRACAQMCMIVNQVLKTLGSTSITSLSDVSVSDSKDAGSDLMSFKAANKKCTYQSAEKTNTRV